ncbi:helix-turn-helix domain-containing protein [Desertivirga xinjiangensis]|uniref:helix-turn-helix domain-containing protein n=1 Tax=Desertivirga xinjiangensis TaxID=539206 RepID=UPI00210E5E6E|nr:helix-turn-helix domain-containing protein [Pedobacter xinjiangensis]
MSALLLAFIIVFTLLTISLHYTAGNKTPFEKILFLYLCYVLFHVSYALFTRHYFADKRYIDGAVPFGLFYGPFFYFAWRASQGKVLSNMMIWLHSVPFLLGCVAYIIMLCSSSFRQDYTRLYYGVLYSSVAISMFFYALKGMFGGARESKAISGDARRLIGIAGMILLIIALFFFVQTYTRLIPWTRSISSWTFFFMYTLIFSSVLIVFRYNIKRLRIRRVGAMELSAASDNSDSGERSRLYKKSALSEKVLAEYEKKLEILMLEEKVYLKTDLSLEGLAAELKIPKHHVTQLFNVHIGKNFYQYINEYRVDHACGLLQSEPKNIKIDELAFLSGFNSKVSFNRYFKKQMDCTPSEFRERLQG